MIRLLILTCGTNANYHISKLLKTKYKNFFYLIGTDINTLWEIPTSPFLDKFYQSPASSDKEYYQFILKVCYDEQIDYILPSFDEDQILFFEGNPDLAAINVCSLGINSKLKDVYSSKKCMNYFLKKHNLPVPRLYTFDDINNDTLYFVKPINGVGSVGAHIMRGESIDYITAANNIIEEVCKEPEITLECFLYKGIIYSVARQRIAHKNGVCTKSKVYNDRYLTSIAQQLANIIPLPHIFNLQFMRNVLGDYVITDVNLRTAAGMSISYAAGWDEISALANIMLNYRDEDILSNIQPVKREQYVMRAYTDIVTKIIENRIAIDLDGTLLDSRIRHRKVMDDVLAEFNISISTDDLLFYKSNGHNNIDWLLDKGINISTATAVQKRWIELIEDEYYLVTDCLYEGVISYLEKLSQDNELFLITARNNENGTREQLKKLGILQFFSDIVIIKSNENASQYKAQYLKEHQIDIIIGDTEVDMKAAQLKGCRFKAVTHGFRSETFWNKKNVEIITFK